MVRPIIFHPKARDQIRRFPKEARTRAGRGLFRLQIGEQLAMPNSRPMSTVSPGVSELRVKGEDGVFRVFYYVASPRGVLSSTLSKRRRNEHLLLKSRSPESA